MLLLDVGYFILAVLYVVSYSNALTANSTYTNFTIMVCVVLYLYAFYAVFHRLRRRCCHCRMSAQNAFAPSSSDRPARLRPLIQRACVWDLATWHWQASLVKPTRSRATPMLHPLAPALPATGATASTHRMSPRSSSPAAATTAAAAAALVVCPGTAGASPPPLPHTPWAWPWDWGGTGGKCTILHALPLPPLLPLLHLPPTTSATTCPSTTTTRAHHSSTASGRGIEIGSGRRRGSGSGLECEVPAVTWPTHTPCPSPITCPRAPPLSPWPCYLPHHLLLPPSQAHHPPPLPPPPLRGEYMEVAGWACVGPLA